MTYFLHTLLTGYPFLIFPIFDLNSLKFVMMPSAMLPGLKYPEMTGVVLSGGKSKRMGRDKALLVFRGRPLVMHGVMTLQRFCNQVVISSNRKDYFFTGCEIWPDDVDVYAPMAGIYSCLKRSMHPWIMVLSCDMPLIDPRVFDLLISRAELHRDDVVVPVHNRDCIEPLCGLYNQRAIPLLEECIRTHRFSLQQFIGSSKSRLVEFGPDLDFYKADMFSNINTIQDFNSLK
jgi:molybdopterin-guanine dinucleotide biosynthesis protein A